MTDKQLVEILEDVANMFSKKPECHLFNNSGICMYLYVNYDIDTHELVKLFNRFPVNNKKITANTMKGAYLFTDKYGKPMSQYQLWKNIDPHRYDRANWAKSALEQLKKEMKND